MTFLAVGVGGALGVLLRAVASDFVKSHTPGDFPWQTLAVNFAACFAIGIAVHLTLDSTFAAMLCVGVLGGFSTMSTMCYEAVAFFRQKRFARCAAYLALTYGSCLAATALGFLLAGAL